MKYKILFIMVICAISGRNGTAEMLIDEARLNGSFESGGASPWTVSSGDSIHAVEDENVAYDGVWYAEVDIDAGRAFVSQHISSITPTISDTFTLSFQARRSTPGPESISARLSSYKTGGAPLSANRIESDAPLLSDTEWQNYSYTFQFEELWDASKDLNISIDFSDGWTSGSKGLLDAIVLEQIPESSTALIFLFGLILIVFIQKQGCNTKYPDIKCVNIQE